MATVIKQQDDGALLKLYFADIAESKPLSREREVELAERIQQGDMAARDELVQANLRFVISVARKHQNRGIDFDDLIAAGNIGLITAAERFDGAKGFKFISYAVWWIRQRILQEIAEQARTVRLPINKLDLIRNINKAAANSKHAEFTDEEIESLAEEFDVSVQEIQSAVLVNTAEVSLDKELENFDKKTLLDLLADKNPLPDALVDDSLMQAIGDKISCLDEREQIIIRLYYGLDEDEALTLEQIGEVFGITRERVRQLKECALKKMRSSKLHLRSIDGNGRESMKRKLRDFHEKHQKLLDQKESREQKERLQEQEERDSADKGSIVVVFDDNDHLRGNNSSKDDILALANMLEQDLGRPPRPDEVAIEFNGIITEQEIYEVLLSLEE